MNSVCPKFILNKRVVRKIGIWIFKFLLYGFFQDFRLIEGNYFSWKLNFVTFALCQTLHLGGNVFQYFVILVFGSPEYKMLKVSYCDYTMSIVLHALLSIICFKWQVLYHWVQPNLKLFPGWASAKKPSQTSLIHQKNGPQGCGILQLKNFKIFPDWSEIKIIW